MAEPIAPFDRRSIVIGAVAFAFVMSLSTRYGFHRDELYFLDAGRHLQGGYVDQPLFAPYLARLSLDWFGVSLPGLRLWPALAGWATVVVGALLARDFGGGRRAQLIAAVGVATMPVLLAVAHQEGPTAFDVLAWAALALVVVRVGRTGDHRWWLLGGVILGLGLTNKHSVGLFAVALLIGAFASGGWRDVCNRWFFAGALIAALFTVPDVVWQARHGWATIEMTHNLSHENGGLGNLPGWVIGQLLMTTAALIWVWLAGLKSLWRASPAMWRTLSWAYGLLFVGFGITTGGQIYYLAGAYVYLLAAGSVRIEGWLTERPRRTPILLALTAGTLAISLPMVLPILPATDTGWIYPVNQALGESVGWPGFVSTVRGAWLSLPPNQRANAVIYTANYGEAGAINELGRGTGLPVAVSSQNSEWWWGPGNPTASTVLAVAPGPVDVTGYRRYLLTYFGSVRTVATLRNAAGIHNEEWDGHVYVCTAPKRPWGQIWPDLRNYG